MIINKQIKKSTFTKFKKIIENIDKKIKEKNFKFNKKELTIISIIEEYDYIFY